MLVEGLISEELFSWMKDKNNEIQEDKDKAMKAFCEKIEELIYKAIKNHEHQIQPGTIIVSGSPTTQSNVAPIILNSVTNIVS